jgi:uncharacterized protein
VSTAPSKPVLARWPAAAQWLALLALSAALSWAWGAAGLPAALLLGPMFAGIAFGVNGANINVPRLPYMAAQGIIGAMVAAALNAAIFGAFARDWLLFSLVMGATLVAAAALGWILSRSRIIPGSTAVWGTSPGAATSMVLLAEAHGADVPLVAFMQYARVLVVALSAALVARFWVGGAPPHAAVNWLAPVDWLALAQTLALIALGQGLGRLLRLSAWALLGPMLLLAAVHLGAHLRIELPRPLLAVCYALLGWYIGLGFRREALLHAWRALPAIVLSILSLMAFCAALAWCLTWLAHVDALTAYLATSPGGMDSVAIIAASSGQVDLSFVMALQGVRLVFVIVLAPYLTRWVVRSSAHLQQASN